MIMIMSRDFYFNFMVNQSVLDSFIVSLDFVISSSPKSSGSDKKSFTVLKTTLEAMAT